MVSVLRKGQSIKRSGKNSQQQQRKLFNLLSLQFLIVQQYSPVQFIVIRRISFHKIDYLLQYKHLFKIRLDQIKGIHTRRTL
ncbi:hypothetical protein FRX31_008523 [Thalictrum thalictroides]|uniref:Uncharacterized protein n=1 Tax=Thalictrum thalictroides TaxID=46969 RepID=A0A7J6WWS1_THATH|nr:hypothetical protein FRX31_008523 [Thalictrum thalictroides]